MRDNLSDIFQHEIHKDERILWTGQPRQGLIVQASDTLSIMMGLLYGGFAIYWGISAINGGAPSYVTSCGLVGFTFIIGRFIVDSMRRSKTCYALTNQRIIIINGFLIWGVRSLELGMLPELALGSINQSGQGTITIGPTRGSEWFIESTSPRLEGIEDARGVYDQIKAAQDEALHTTQRS